MLLPVHPLTQASQEPIVPGQVTRQDIAIFPTMAELPTGWRLRVTITTGDTPHLFPTVAQVPKLVGGIYQVQRNVPCGAICSAAGP
jgi:predicted acyl esterase